MRALSVRRVRGTLLVVSILAIVALAVTLRLADPLSSTVIPAEDPYTHMTLVREHVREGDLNPLYPNGDLYPPGLHAVLATVWVYTGLDLYDIFRFGPVALGALGVLGMALLLHRFLGPAAAIVGALSLAVAPEAIFRTTMMSPTAMDLALLPFFLYALLEVAIGRMAWLGIALPFAAFLVFLHPWLFGLLVLTGVVFALLSTLQPWATLNGRRVTPAGLLAAAAVISAGMAGVLSTCGGTCGPGFGELFPIEPYGPLLTLAMALVAGLALACVTVRRNRLAAKIWRPLAPASSPTRVAASVVLAALLAGLAALAHSQGLPESVDLPRMFGWPILILAALGLVCVPFLANPIGHLGAAFAIATFPLVVFNPLNSPFWPHRTAVFLGVALVILVGCAARAIGLAIHAAAAHLHRSHAEPHRPRRTLIAAALVALVAHVTLVGTVYAATPDGYEGGWYRLYGTCEAAAFQDIAELADTDPAMLVLTGTWESKLFVASGTSDADRVWYTQSFFTSPEQRETLLAHLEKESRPLLVVTDRYLPIDHPEAETGFLQSSDWEPAGAWCAGHGGFSAPRVQAYRFMGASA